MATKQNGRPTLIPVMTGIVTALDALPDGVTIERIEVDDRIVDGVTIGRTVDIKLRAADPDVVRRYAPGATIGDWSYEKPGRGMLVGTASMDDGATKIETTIKAPVDVPTVTIRVQDGDGRYLPGHQWDPRTGHSIYKVDGADALYVMPETQARATDWDGWGERNGGATVRILTSDDPTGDGDPVNESAARERRTVRSFAALSGAGAQGREADVDF